MSWKLYEASGDIFIWLEAETHCTRDFHLKTTPSQHAQVVYICIILTQQDIHLNLNSMLKCQIIPFACKVNPNVPTRMVPICNYF